MPVERVEGAGALAVAAFGLHAAQRTPIWRSDTLVMIGPEGDFSPREIEEAAKAGFENLDLGQTRLRTETAGVVVCSNISFMKEFL